MNLSKEKECPSQVRSWTQGIVSKEGRDRKIKGIRLSAKTSLFNLPRTTSFSLFLNQNDEVKSGNKRNFESSETLPSLKRISSFDLISIDKKFEKCKKSKKARTGNIFVATEKDVNLSIEMGQDKNPISSEVYSPDSLKYLNDSNDCKRHTNHEESQNLNMSLSSEVDVESSQFEDSKNDQDFFSHCQEIRHRHSIFFNSLKEEEEELREDLQVENDPDIHFIQGNLFSYYQEREILGEGTSGIVKKPPIFI